MSTPGTPGTPLSATPSTEPVTSGGIALRVLLVDDEELARLRLRGLLRDCADPAAQVIGEAGQAQQALALLQSQPCDLVLLDIHMPGLDGLQLASQFAQLLQPPAVVFVTAHAEHALRAFELDAVDYLTKPVKRDRLQAALQRVAQRRLARPLAPAAPDDEATLVVSDRGRIVRVPVAEVLYLKAELKYVTLRTADHTYVLDESLSDLETRLGARFLRVHRNALVARRAVRALERRVLIGEGDDDGGETWAVRLGAVDEWLAVSRRQVAAVREALLAAGL
jgi:two-component system, LytTR family, response regulator AlgR